MEEAEQTHPLRKRKVTSEVRLNERICALLVFEAIKSTLDSNHSPGKQKKSLINIKLS